MALLLQMHQQLAHMQPTASGHAAPSTADATAQPAAATAADVAMPHSASLLHAAAEHRQAKQQQQQQQQALDAAAAAPSAGHASASAPGTYLLNERKRKRGSSAAASAALTKPEGFPAGTQLRLWQQESLVWRRMFTGSVYEFTSMGCIGKGGNGEAYLVQLNSIVKQQEKQPAAAGCSDGQAAGLAAAGEATTVAGQVNAPAIGAGGAAGSAAAGQVIDAAGRHSNKAVTSLQVGGLYVLKVCRLLQDLTAEERGYMPLGSCNVGKYLHNVRTQLLNEQACYERLAGSTHFVHCFAYGTAGAMVPGAAAAAAPAPDQERPCLLLEYGQCGSIAAQLCSADGQSAGMSEQQARDVMLHAAMALQDCHKQSIIYKDVQPGNIVICQDPEGKRVLKMIDCGSSSMMAGDLGCAGHLFGMPSYRAPEMRPGSNHNYTVDTWHLGCLLLHLRTGGCLVSFLVFLASCPAELIELYSVLLCLRFLASS
jgi:serine/threonine protein kinase